MNPIVFVSLTAGEFIISVGIGYEDIQLGRLNVTYSAIENLHLVTNICHSKELLAIDFVLMLGGQPGAFLNCI